MRTRIKKGDYGYLTLQKKKEVLKTAILFLLVFGIFGIGYVTTETRLNLLTVVAVLSALPASKSAVSMIMFLRFSTGSKEVYERVAEESENLTVVYDLVITTGTAAVPIHCAVIEEGMILAYSEGKIADVNGLEKHIKALIKKNGYSVSVKIFQKLDAYLERLRQLNGNERSEEQKNNNVTVAQYLLGISL